MIDTDVTIRCLVTSGMFSSEYLVRIEDSGRLLWEGAADKELVVLDKNQTVHADRYVSGRIAAYCLQWDDNNKSAIVEVASDGLAQGRRFSVSAAMIKPQRLPA